MFRTKSLFISIIFIIIDALTIYAVFRFSTVIRGILSPLLQRPPVTWDAVVVVAELSICVIIAMFLLLGLYPGYGLTAIKELENTAKAITLAFILIASVSYLNKPFQDLPRSIYPIAWFLSICFVPIIRFVARNLLSRTNFYGSPVIVFGEGEWAQEIINSLHRVRRLGWRPAALYSPINVQYKNKFNASDIAILASSPDVSVSEQVRKLNQYFKKVILIEKAENLGSLWVETRDMDSYLGLEFHYHLLSRQNRWIKVAMDMSGALILLILLSPVLIILSILVASDSSGSVFFRQQRLGKDLREFKVIKFRTMVSGAEEKLDELLQTDAKIKKHYEEFHKIEIDPRVTKIGCFLRKFSLDELPQLWNVLRGEMSLIGPRAYMPSELESMQTYKDTIFRVKPGMTGWWQVLGRHQISFRKRLQMDEYYISNWSIWMDIYILLKTVFVVLNGKGA